MSIADMLADEFEAAQISKNDVIRKTGIDRSTFYQILGNRRMATPVQFLRILNVLQPDAADRAHLLRQYERERVGEEKFAKYEKVRSFLRRLSEGADDVGGGSGSTTSCPEQIASLIRHALQKEGRIRLRLLLPTELFFSLGIEKVLEENVRSGSTVCVEQLLSDWDGSSDSDAMIRGFADYLTLLKRNPGFQLNAWMTDEVLFHPEGTPFPFYIIDDDAMVMFDHTGRKCMQVQDPAQIGEFTRHFDRLLQHARPVVTQNRNMTEMFANMSGILLSSSGPEGMSGDPSLPDQRVDAGEKILHPDDPEPFSPVDPERSGADGSERSGAESSERFGTEVPNVRKAPDTHQIFLISDTPCVWLSTTREQESSYINFEEGLAYGDLLRSLNIIEFTSRERISRLFSRRRISEGGVNIEIRKEDIPVLRAAVRTRIGGNLFLLNEDVQPLPMGYVIFVAGDGRMIFGPYQENGFQVYVQNWDFGRELYDWFATRISTVNPERENCTFAAADCV